MYTIHSVHLTMSANFHTVMLKMYTIVNIGL